jgi:hypothetical protein
MAVGGETRRAGRAEPTSVEPGGPDAKDVGKTFKT